MPPHLASTSTQQSPDMKLTPLFDNLWSLYKKHNPQAQQICSLLMERGETVVNDHIAFRTFQHPFIGIHSIAEIFTSRGYTVKGEYTFTEKKLNAIHLEPESEQYPLIFISELVTKAFSPFLQKTVQELIDQIHLIPPDPKFLWSKTQWNRITYSTYQKLLEESEYAAWTASFGFQANHFTILVNALKHFDIRQLNQFLKHEGFMLNQSGGEIKGSREALLEQSSTLAPKMEVTFEDQKIRVPSCYYEFAQRYENAQGEIFRGFIASSADKIFESTDNR